MGLHVTLTLAPPTVITLIARLHLNDISCTVAPFASGRTRKEQEQEEGSLTAQDTISRDARVSPQEARTKTEYL
jgi:hypothetical protein